ncbi:MAG: ribonuclease H-like domain-containing protein [Candidatus Nanoarchaeia archaeon]
MIKESFIFLNCIGEKKEKQIWSQGIKDWNDFKNSSSIKGLSKKTKKICDAQITEASKALNKNNSSFFVDKLQKKHSWRLYETFRNEACFFDIETSGNKKNDYMIAAGIFDGFNTKTMIKRINLNFNILEKELRKYKLIVTFNGSSFDIPFLKKRYPLIVPKIPHIDLKHACFSAGLKNKLKDIEKKFGISRNPLIEKMNGGDVYRLWRMYFASGDEHYLRLLVEYNEEDASNLKKIADFVIKELKNQLTNTKTFNN